MLLVSYMYRIVERLNEFFDLVVPILVKYGGHANKFVGDGVLGVFGAPDRLRDHADRALEAACEIAESVEERFGGRLRIGIGINSGPVIAGSIGGGGRLEFTVIGDPVNVAARVEGLTKDLGRKIIITQAVVDRIGDRFHFDPLGSHKVKGHSPVDVWGIRTARKAPASVVEAEAVQ